MSDIHRWGRKSSRLTCSLSILSGLSYNVGLWESGETGAGGEPETATWLSRSVARRVEPGVARAFLLAVEVVMEGSVALERSSLGRRPPLDLDESLLCMVPRRESVGGDAISSSNSVVWWKKVGI